MKKDSIGQVCLWLCSLFWLAGCCITNFYVYDPLPWWSMVFAPAVLCIAAYISYLSADIEGSDEIVHGQDKEKIYRLILRLSWISLLIFLIERTDTALLSVFTDSELWIGGQHFSKEYLFAPVLLLFCRFSRKCIKAFIADDPDYGIIGSVLPLTGAALWTGAIFNGSLFLYTAVMGFLQILAVGVMLWTYGKDYKVKRYKRIAVFIAFVVVWAVLLFLGYLSRNKYYYPEGPIGLFPFKFFPGASTACMFYHAAFLAALIGALPVLFPENHSYRIRDSFGAFIAIAALCGQCVICLSFALIGILLPVESPAIVLNDLFLLGFLISVFFQNRKRTKISAVRIEAYPEDLTDAEIYCLTPEGVTGERYEIQEKVKRAVICRKDGTRSEYNAFHTGMVGNDIALFSPNDECGTLYALEYLGFRGWQPFGDPELLLDVAEEHLNKDQG